MVFLMYLFVEIPVEIGLDFLRLVLPLPLYMEVKRFFQDARHAHTRTLIVFVTFTRRFVSGQMSEDVLNHRDPEIMRERRLFSVQGKMIPGEANARAEQSQLARIRARAKWSPPGRLSGQTLSDSATGAGDALDPASQLRFVCLVDGAAATTNPHALRTRPQGSVQIGIVAYLALFSWVFINRSLAPVLERLVVYFDEQSMCFMADSVYAVNTLQRRTRHWPCPFRRSNPLP